MDESVQRKTHAGSVQRSGMVWNQAARRGRSKAVWHAAEHAIWKRIDRRGRRRGHSSAENLGRGSQTDLLVLSFSSNDYVGHQSGPDSPQVRDISIATDRLLGKLFRFVDAHVGMNNVTVVFTCGSWSSSDAGDKCGTQDARAGGAIFPKFGTQCKRRSPKVRRGQMDCRHAGRCHIPELGSDREKNWRIERCRQVTAAQAALSSASRLPGIYKRADDQRRCGRTTSWGAG